MALGFEAEILRKITDNNNTVLTGDTKLVSHPWFRLVSDKVNAGNGQYSNMEYVVRHVDQLAGTDQNAADLVGERVAALMLMNDELYAAQNQLVNLLTDPQPGNQAIQFYIDPVYGNTGNLNVRNCPAAGVDQGLLHIHYTVGFAPAQWRAMLNGIAPATRPDSANVRSRTHLTNGIAVADTIVNNTLNVAIGATGAQAATVRTELRGHLALLYMHAMVWIDRMLANQRNDLQTAVPVNHAKLNQVLAQLPFGDGQVKNKIAALPRATLAQMWGVLSAGSRQVLSGNVDPVLNALAAKVENAHGIDFPDNYQLTSPTAGTTSLVTYITSGLNGQNGISQEVLFGGMNQTGVDNSIVGHPMVPFEFRALYNAHVTWGDLRADVIRIARWSRDLTRSLV
ncbi:hypothetical protein [Phytomonospora endophytica]|uniref:Uncharacterized protein n=1 Tax=Phytomonospora endophytica TaxID=714109 RepID=A0A841FX10_9ACTN|nr:hypothetical protein [Phytomonospora endophytica]MBB6037887.1 hypothetical protein [Phytomonospora endophytica]GIG68787.1 hypothetical protein Pen01_50820 [Phytomonospora endophytica]